MLEKVDVEEAQGKTDGMIGNLVAEVNNLYLLYHIFLINLLGHLYLKLSLIDPAFEPGVYSRPGV